MLVRWIPMFAKGLLGGLIAGLSSMQASLSGGSTFTYQNVITAILAGLIGFAGVSAIPNKDKQ